MRGVVRNIIIALLFFSLPVGYLSAQDESTESSLPEIFYSSPQEYLIAGIDVQGIDSYDASDKEYLIRFAGLSVGSRIKLPGDEITRAIRKLYDQRSFSDVSILLDRVSGDRAWLVIKLTPRHQVSHIFYWGLKKAEENKVKEQLDIEPGTSINDMLIERIKRRVERALEEKGFSNTTVRVLTRDDPDRKNYEIIDVVVERKNKVKIKSVTITGNEEVKERVLKKSMKKTREKSFVNLFRSSKYIEDSYESDKYSLLDKYNELGYRDAAIITDSVVELSDNKVSIYIDVEEGHKYYFNNITWIGNTVYDSDLLTASLNIKKGDVYNKTYFDEQLDGEEGVKNEFYANRGYLFVRTFPTERIVGNDSIDVEIRLIEGPQAAINRVNIAGNTKTHDHVIRRELYVYPGELYSREDIVRSIRELANLGHFDNEALSEGLDIEPDIDNGTVDITFGLVEKGNDKFEISGGWGAGMIMASVGLTFTNFSIRNIFNWSTYRPLPQGDGQTLSINVQTNGKYYSNYSISFMEPWLGGKKPNSLSLHFFYSHQSGYSSSYYRHSYYVNSAQSSSDYNTDQHINIWGFSLGLGRRVKWPDDYFTIYNELSYQHYNLKSWPYYIFEDGVSNNLALTTSIRRSSIDNPMYTRYGSDFGMSLAFTFPYSLVNKKNYADQNMTSESRYKWIEYHKWKFYGKMFIPLDKKFKTVLYLSAQLGYLGYYNKHFRSPFEGYEMGGDGMSGYSLYAREYIGLRGYSNGSLTNAGSNFISDGSSDASLYEKMTIEVRYPISLKDAATIYALAFFEAGNSWAKIRDFEPFNLYRSAGVGVRIFLPMLGMIGIDWGYGFDEVQDRSGANGSQFHFVLGQEF